MESYFLFEPHFVIILHIMVAQRCSMPNTLSTQKTGIKSQRSHEQTVLATVEIEPAGRRRRIATKRGRRRRGRRAQGRAQRRGKERGGGCPERGGSSQGGRTGKGGRGAEGREEGEERGRQEEGWEEGRWKEEVNMTHFNDIRMLSTVKKRTKMYQEDMLSTSAKNTSIFYS